jgi:PHD/YefM family antitoxin component YafN of YafNO toxin-antitoxin module
MAAFVINATEFKTKCLAILDDEEVTGNTVTVTKRGRPVATDVLDADDLWEVTANKK